MLKSWNNLKILESERSKAWLNIASQIEWDACALAYENNCQTNDANQRANEKRKEGTVFKWRAKKKICESPAFLCDRRLNLFQSHFIFIGIKGNAIRK